MASKLLTILSVLQASPEVVKVLESSGLDLGKFSKAITGTGAAASITRAAVISITSGTGPSSKKSQSDVRKLEKLISNQSPKPIRRVPKTL